MPIYYNILVAEFLAREHGPVLFWLRLPWNSYDVSLEEAGGGGWVGVATTPFILPLVLLIDVARTEDLHAIFFKLVHSKSQ